MLPSTGYFKSINCPFYDSGTCDRPYCHFKHLRRDDASNPAPSIIGYSTSSPKPQKDETIEGSEKSRATTESSDGPNSEMIQQLVSDAVSKALADQGVTDTDNVSKNIVSKVVEGLKPKLVPTIGKHSGVPQSIIKPPCVYNPTPISELKKRHIAVPVYNPVRESRVAVKRKSTEDTVKPWLSVLPESIKTDQRGANNEVTYKPTAIVHDKDAVQTLNYVPTVKSDDSNSSDYPKRKEVYYPQSKKRREEYVPKKIKAPLQSLQQMDEVALDSFEPELDLMNDILVNDSQNPQNCDSNSHDLYNVEGEFSDEDVMKISEKAETTQEVKKHLESIKETRRNKIKEEIQKKRHKNEEIKSSDDKNFRRGSASSESSKHSENDKDSIKSSNNEVSKEKKQSNCKSSRSDKERRNSHNKKESKHHRSSSNSSEKHRSSSSSKHSENKSHKDKSNSSSRSSRNKSDHSSSRRDKSSSSKENNHHKSSKHDKHKSSTSNKKSSSKSARRESSSNHRSKDSKRDSAEKIELNSDKNESDNDSLDRVFDNSFEEFLQSSDSEHDVEEECLKIFQEYQITEHPKGITSKKMPKQEEEEIEDVGKKRVAHPSAANSVRNLGPVHPPKRLPNPQQRMYERWRLMKEAAAGKAAERAIKQATLDNESNNHPTDAKPDNVASSKPITSETQMNGASRVRIAHVPYAMSLAISKKKVVDATSKPAELKTVAQTTTKGTPRVAHIPQSVPTLVRPEPLQVLTQKFPINVRQYYVNLMHDICVQIYTNGDDAAQRALREEHSCHERCKALAVYKNSCMLAAHRLRKEVDQGGTDGSGPSASGMVSHNAVLAGKTKGSWSVVKVKRAVTDFKGAALYSMLKKWIMTEQQLKDNGFPRTHPDGTKGRAKYYAVRGQPLLSKVPNERYCVRCGKPYMVDKQGNAVQAQNCIYHWGRKFTIRGEGKYSCCQQDGSASGCCDAKTHVWDYVNYENLRGYVQTLPKDIPPEEQGVYALDCEMCYTTQGIELTRVTVINEDCNVIYETLVKPENLIIDYNTRFSGITEENMVGVTTTILDVQATLLSMFSDNTILVGHSLESDFKALKLIHNTVVDTSMMFPHKHGLPHKRALKNLCSEYLRKIIQNDVGGHDSKEDAVSCMELVHWKVKEEAKLQ